MKLKLALGLSALFFAGSLFATHQVGQAAPAFTLTDSKGQSHSLADFAGKTVVLESTNHDCPFVVKHYSGNMQSFTKTIWYRRCGLADGDFLSPRQARSCHWRQSR